MRKGETEKAQWLLILIIISREFLYRHSVQSLWLQQTKIEICNYSCISPTNILNSQNIIA